MKCARDRREPVGAGRIVHRRLALRRPRKLKWMWTPLPVPFGSRIGEKMARWPSRNAVARAISRSFTASSAAFIPSAGAQVTSYWRAPYSGRKESGSTPALRIAAISTSPKMPCRR